jgi:hypothetical protein
MFALVSSSRIERAGPPPRGALRRGVRSGRRVAALAVGLILAACSAKSSDSPQPGPSISGTGDADAWLLSKPDEDRFAAIARQLRGFDVAMAETGYRYGELYWAGQDQNWDYAKYQVEKIRLAVKNGVERRPKRGPSAEMLEGALLGVEEAIAAKDAKSFGERFAALTATCNARHRAERVPFVNVRPPTVRVSPVGPPASADAE